MSIALLLAAIMQLPPQPAAASDSDWRIKMDVSWSGNPPIRVTVHAPDTGGNDFLPSAAPPMRIDYDVRRHVEEHPLTVHFQFVTHAFSVLPRLGEPAFRLRVAVPRNMNCDNRIVTNVARQARSNEAEYLANAGVAASYLLQRRTNKCTSHNVGRLRRALLNSHCNLAKNTVVFSVPSFPETALEREAAQCRQIARVRLVSRQFNQAGSEARSGNYAALDVSLAGLGELRNDANWAGAFAAARLDDNNLRHLEVQGLYNRAVPLRNDGQLEAAAPFASALATLADRPEYQEAFRRADLPPADAKSIHFGIVKQLEPPPAELPDQPQ